MLPAAAIGDPPRPAHAYYGLFAVSLAELDAAEVDEFLEGIIMTPRGRRRC